MNHDIRICIKNLHQLIKQSDREAEPFSQVAFLDSIILTSLSHILETIDKSTVNLTEEDSGLMTEIKNFSDSISRKLHNHTKPQGTCNYFYSKEIPLVQFDLKPQNFTYTWIKDHLESEPLFINLPDDIDSTFSSLFAMRKMPGHNSGQHNINASDPHAFAKTLKNLDSIRHPEKPFIFNTWFSNKEGWQSIDIIALSSIAAYLDLYDHEYAADLKNFIFDSLVDFFSRIQDIGSQNRPQDQLQNQSMQTPHWISDFYHSIPLALYMFSRCAWSANQNKKLIELAVFCLQFESDNLPHAKEARTEIKNRIKVSNRTDRLLYLCALNRLGHAEHSVAVVEPGPAADPLYIHSLTSNKTIYAESTLFSRLLLCEYQITNLLSKNSDRKTELAGTTGNSIKNIISPYSSIRSYITNKIFKQFKELSIFNSYHSHIEELLLSQDFRICLDIQLLLNMSRSAGSQKETCNESLREFMFEPLLSVHAFGLFSYYLYDKIYDQELGTSHLPVLVCAYRLFSQSLHAALLEVQKIKVIIPDELLNILLKTDMFYLNLARQKHRHSRITADMHGIKSLGICLIPCLSLLTMGIKQTECFAFIDFFKYFCAARQISDDAKDEDQDSGKITSLETLSDQQEIENVIFTNIIKAKDCLDKIITNSSASHTAKYTCEILQVYLDDLTTQAMRAKWQLEVIKLL